METSSITSQRGFILTGHCEPDPNDTERFVVWVQTTPENEQGERCYYYYQNSELVGETRQGAPRTVADSYGTLDAALAIKRRLLTEGADDQDLHNVSESDREDRNSAT